MRTTRLIEPPFSLSTPDGAMVQGLKTSVFDKWIWESTAASILGSIDFV